MKQYLDVLKDIIENGNGRPDRTSIGHNRSVFGRQMRFKMSDGFPIVTVKPVPFKLVKAELLWFLAGSQNVKELQEMGCHIWDDNANSDYWKPKAKFDGDVGRIYGVQWRKWRSYGGVEIDQIGQLIDGIKRDPFGRRHIVTAWNPGELNEMCLPPCHMLFHCYVSSDNKLSLHLFQRSCDMVLGVPFNIPSYALLLNMIAQLTYTAPHELIVTLSDAHIYTHPDHQKAAELMLQREPYPLPKLWLNPAISDIKRFALDDMKLIGYKSHPHIYAPMAV